MPVAEQIQAQVDHLVEQANSDILANVLDGTCSHCNYRENKTKFNKLLRIYSAYKIEIYRSENWTPYAYMNRLGTYPHDNGSLAQVKARAIREKLTEIWPCKTCVILFNPTNKKRQPWLIL